MLTMVILAESEEEAGRIVQEWIDDTEPEPYAGHRGLFIDPPLREALELKPHQVALPEVGE